MSAAHDDLEAWWRQTGREPARTEDAAAIVRELERLYTLPSDFRAYLLSAALEKDVDDDAFTSWWSIDRVRNIDEECTEEYTVSWESFISEADKSQYLLFADYAIWIWAWGVCCKPGEDFGKIAVVGRNPDRFIANSFSELISFYLHDPEHFGLFNSAKSEPSD